MSYIDEIGTNYYLGYGEYDYIRLRFHVDLLEKERSRRPYALNIRKFLIQGHTSYNVEGRPFPFGGYLEIENGFLYAKPYILPYSEYKGTIFREIDSEIHSPGLELCQKLRGDYPYLDICRNPSIAGFLRKSERYPAVTINSQHRPLQLRFISSDTEENIMDNIELPIYNNTYQKYDSYLNSRRNGYPNITYRRRF